MEKFENKTCLYCLYDKVTKKYDSFSISMNDEDAKNYFLDQVSQVAFDLANKADTMNYNRLFSNLKDTCFMRIASFNDELGVFENSQVVLIDYISAEAIENFIKSKFELQAKFKDLVPKKDNKKEGN